MVEKGIPSRYEDEMAVPAKFTTTSKSLQARGVHPFLVIEDPIDRDNLQYFPMKKQPDGTIGIVLDLPIGSKYNCAYVGLDSRGDVITWELDPQMERNTEKFQYDAGTYIRNSTPDYFIVDTKGIYEY